MSALRTALGLLVLTLSVAALGQQPDYHLTADRFHDVYAHSPFIHGHRHGYEEGFHTADQDLHLGRHSQLATRNFHIPKLKRFGAFFGNKKSFRRGYEAGFCAGYFDSYSGREFSHLPQGFALPMSATAVAPDSSPSGVGQGEFDSGAFEGYQAASSDLSHFELRPGITKYAEDFCHKNLVRGTSPDYCSGYGSGYVLGRVDSTRKIAPESDNPVRAAVNLR